MPRGGIRYANEDPFARGTTSLPGQSTATFPAARKHSARDAICHSPAAVSSRPCLPVGRPSLPRTGGDVPPQRRRQLVDRPPHASGSRPACAARPPHRTAPLAGRPVVCSLYLHHLRPRHAAEILDSTPRCDMMVRSKVQQCPMCAPYEKKNTTPFRNSVQLLPVGPHEARSLGQQ